MLELLLILANLHEYVAHHSVNRLDPAGLDPPNCPGTKILNSCGAEERANTALFRLPACLRKGQQPRGLDLLQFPDEDSNLNR